MITNGERRRPTGSSRRAAAKRTGGRAGSSARPAKRAASGMDAADTPTHIRAVGVSVDAAAKTRLRKKLDRKLGKFGRHIERTSVRIADVNGPRGGIDKRCRIKVVLSGLPSVVVEERRRSLQAAIDGALTRVEQAVRGATRSRRARARRPRRSGEPTALGRG